jgi:hypothetical protein
MGDLPYTLQAWGKAVLSHVALLFTDFWAGESWKLSMFRIRLHLSGLLYMSWDVREISFPVYILISLTPPFENRRPRALIVFTT